MISAFVLGLWGKVKVPFLFVGGLLVAIAIAWRRAREDGKNQILHEQQVRRDEAQQKYDHIDAQRPDLDASLGRLRNRSGSHPK